MNGDEKRRIVAAFSEECQTDQKRIKDDNGFITYNSRAMTAWDLRFKRICQVADSLGFEIIRASRSILWEFIGIFSEGELYLFFKDKNIKLVLKECEDNPYHYVLCALGFNESANDKSNNVQLELLENEFKEKRNEINTKLFGAYYEKIKEVRIFTIDEFNGKAIRAEELFLDSKGNYVEVTDYSDAISTDYTSIINQEAVDKKDLLVGLKPGIKKIDMSVVDLKNTNNEIRENKD